MKRMVLQLAMLVVLLTGTGLTDVFAISDQCRMDAGVMTDLNHPAETASCDEGYQLCEQLNVTEARVYPGFSIPDFWDDHNSFIWFKKDLELIRSGFPSSVFHPPRGLPLSA